MTSSPSHIRLQNQPLREAILAGVLVFSIAAAGVCYIAWHALENQSEVVRGDLERTARGAAGLVDGDLHEQVVAEGRMDTDNYRRALRPLVAFHRGLPEIAYLYTLTGKDGRFYFGLDTAQAAEALGFNRPMEASPLGEPYNSQSPEEDRAEMEALLKGVSYVSARPFSDDYGTFLTGVAPIKNSKGQTVAILGVDLKVDDYIARKAHVNQATWIAVTMTFVASCLVGFFIYRFRRGIQLREQETASAQAKNLALIENDRRLVSALGQIIYHFDPASGQITWRGDCERLLGYPATQLPMLPSRLDSLVHPGDVRTFTDWDKAAPSEENLIIREIRCLHRDGREVWMLDRAVLSRDAEGKPSAVDGVMLDISERKKFEADLIGARDAAEAAGRAKSDFLAVMSHEIRTPMNGVLGCANLLLETNLTPQQREYLTTIAKCGDSLLHLINDILDFSKMESDKLSLESREFSLRNCVAEVLELYGHMAAEKNIELLAAFPDPGIDQIVGDEVRLKQIIVNLVGNALKFTTHGEVTVTVTRKPWLPAGEGLMISVKDTGIGISQEKQANIFQPFSQADSSTTRRFGGTGLGLAICGRLATLMGGAITVHSSPGKGADFIVLLPFQSAAPSKNPFPFEQAKGRSVMIWGRRDSTNETLATNLRSRGFSVQIHRDTSPPLLAGTDFAVVDSSISADQVSAGRFQGGGKTKWIGLRPTLFEPSLASLWKVFDAVLSKPLHPDQPARLICEMLTHPEGVPSARKEKSISDGDFARRHPLRILVAEDNPTNRKVVGHMLRRLGYTPQMAENGAICVDMVRSGQFDMVFMDVQMPEMDGYEATSTLRNDGNGIWITALTADAMPEDPLRCRIAGMNDYLSKPIKADRLKQAIEKCAVALAARPN